MSTTMAAPLCIAVDWGSSNLRCYLVAQDGWIVEEKVSEQGMLALAQEDFGSVLEALIRPWFAHQVPVLLAGMVGSRGGWQEVPYLSCPVALTELGQFLFPLNTSWPVPAAIVPGLQALGTAGSVEVMRGEETQLLGLASAFAAHDTIHFCLPGTHCKWGTIENGQLACFSTTMTGELFALLNQSSSLTKGLDRTHESFDPEAFDQGVAMAAHTGGLLHQLFSVRSRWVTGELPPAKVASYLSGILIGSDVLQMAEHMTGETVHLVGSDRVCESYQRVLQQQGIAVQKMSASDASIRGFQAIARRLKERG